MAEFYSGTVEHIPIVITDDGRTVTTGVELSVVPVTGMTAPDPATWTPADVEAGGPALRVAGMTPGRYYVWARWTSGADRPLRGVGYVTIRGTA